MAVQTCDQAITFRNFNYARALEVVQDEQYLDDIDFDEIRLRRKQGEVFQAIDNFNEKIENNYINTHDFPEDSDIFHREKRGCCEPVTKPNITIKDHPWEIGAKILVGVGILLAMNPPPGLTPNTSPQCGQPGGGGCPGSNNPGDILSLVPAGLTPVATFPPFVNPFRDPRANVVAVIFKEPTGTCSGDNTGGTGFEPFRRSSGYSRQPSLLDRFRKNISCLGPRLAARFGKKPAPVVNYGYGKKKRDTGCGYHVQEECGTIEDCFDQPCPRFGIVVKATFTRRTPSYGSGYGLTERQTGEGFKSAAPPDCRVTGSQEVPVPVVQDTRTVPIQEIPQPQEVPVPVVQDTRTVPIQEIPQPQPQDQILPDFQGIQPVQIETAPEAPNQVQDFYYSPKQSLDPYKHYPYTTLHHN